jgi:anti-sigma B factor antagonist
MDRIMLITTDASTTTRLAVRGELDLETVPTLRAAVQHAQRLRPTVRIDLAGVAFIDAVGIGALINLAADARRTGRRLVIDNPSPPVRRIAALTQTASALGLA